MSKYLPPLPDALIVRRNAHGFNHSFTEGQMREYGELCRRDLQAEANEYRKAADDMAMAHKVERDGLNGLLALAQAEGCELLEKLAALEGQEPVAWQFQCEDGEWKEFIHAKHRADTEADGRWPIRALYLAAGAAPQAQPLTQEQAEELAHRRCKRYIHIDTVAPYQFDGSTLMDFVRDAAAHGIKGVES